MKNTKLLKVKELIVEVTKEEGKLFKEFTKNHEIRFMIGELDGFETLLPAKFSIWYDKKSKSYIASLVTLLWKSYAKNPTIIPFSKINEYINC